MATNKKRLRRQALSRKQNTSKEMLQAIEKSDEIF